MTPAYQTWMNKHVPADPTGKCAEVTEAMAKAFPELRRVRGHYLGAGMREPWPHWWLVDCSGAIVDPTAAQWPDQGRGMYEEHNELGPEPTGKCPNCAGYCYDHRDLCSPTCEREYVAYLNSPFGRWG